MPNDIVQPHSAEPQAHPADASAIDAMLEHGGPRSSHGMPLIRLADSSGKEAVLRSNAAGWLRAVGQAPVAPVPPDLASRTMARIMLAKAEKAALNSEVEGMQFGGGLRWPELAAAIAIVLTGLLLALPGFERVRSDARKVACADNLDVSGQALMQYASDNKGALPRLSTQPGSVWWNVGKVVKGAPPQESNSAHLYNLIRTGHVAASRLNCPENAAAPRENDRSAYDWSSSAQVSYSYQNQFATRVSKPERNAHIALLADKNPLFAGVSGFSQSKPVSYLPGIPSDSPSSAHGGRGQNILLANGAVSWQRTPVISGGDNIWTTNRAQETYNGTEIPTDPNDSFLVP